MDKRLVFEALCDKLEAEIETSVGASRDAADYATDEEARAESKYDTQGLEASYLAAGQASMAHTLAGDLGTLRNLREDLILPREKVLRGAMVECDFGDFSEWFYVCPVGGGETLEVEGLEVSVLTGKSPLGSSLLGKKAGDSFRLSSGAEGRVLQVL